MLPSSWLTVVFFLLLVAPGLLFDLLAARRRVGVSESAFREVSRIVLASLAFSALGVTSVIACHVFWPTAFPELDKVLVDETYVRTNPRLVVTAVVTGTAIAMVLAGVTHWVLARAKPSKLRPVSLWAEALREECPPGRHPYAWVRVADGTMYIGKVRSYTADLDLAGRELSLCSPLYIETDDGLHELDQWERIVIPGTSIESMAVQYREGEAQRPGRNRLLNRFSSPKSSPYRPANGATHSGTSDADLVPSAPAGPTAS
jgi:uncharacterized membrane protein